MIERYALATRTTTVRVRLCSDAGQCEPRQSVIPDKPAAFPRGNVWKGFTRLDVCALFCARSEKASIMTAPAFARRSASLGLIFQRLAERSSRPRYAFMVLNLISEAAGARGLAGPYVERAGARTPLRDWLAGELMPLSGRDRRRDALRARIAAELQPRLSGDAERDAATIDAAVEEEALAVGKANVSRAVTDLVRAGMVRRHYAGRITDHPNRGGKRLAVYAVDAEVMAAIRTRATLI